MDSDQEYALCRTTAEIDAFVRAWQECALPQRLWTHPAHLTVALWHLTRFDAAEATLHLRFGIQRFNEACGVEMTPEDGYHETITLFFVWAVGRFLDKAGRDRPLPALREELLQSRWADKRAPLAYYSRERIMSWAARTRWVEPDLRPLEDAP